MFSSHFLKQSLMDIGIDLTPGAPAVVYRVPTPAEAAYAQLPSGAVRSIRPIPIDPYSLTGTIDITSDALNLSGNVTGEIYLSFRTQAGNGMSEFIGAGQLTMTAPGTSPIQFRVVSDNQNTISTDPTGAGWMMVVVRLEASPTAWGAVMPTYYR
jgi:hypothetical protein